MPTVPVVSILGELWELPQTSLAERWDRCIVSPQLDQKPRTLALHSTPHAWTSRATVASIKARSGEWLMFHAAGVSTPEGSVAALIGPSGAGKSTAVRVLCTDLYGYVTDETVAIDTNGKVVPFPKPIALITAVGSRGKDEVGPDELGLLTCPAELTLGAMLVLERRQTGAPIEIEVLDLFQGLMAVMSQTSALPQLPGPLKWLATAAECCGGVHRVRYANASELPVTVQLALDAPPVQSGFVHHPPVEPGSECGREVEPRGGALLRRGTYTDAIESAGEVLLLLGSTCLQLSGIGALLWLAADRPRTDMELSEEVVRQAGCHPDAEEILISVIAELQSLGVVVRDND